MAVPMHSTATPAGKGYPSERTAPGANAKAPSASTSTQQNPSRPSSAAPGSRPGKELAKSAANTETSSSYKVEPSTSMTAEVLRSGPPANMTYPLDTSVSPNFPLRSNTGGNANPGFLPHPYFSTPMNMNVSPQAGYGAAPMQYYPANFNPNPYNNNQPTNQARPGPSMQQKYPSPIMDPKYSAAPNTLGPSGVSPQMPHNMSRRPSNYFVAPSMSPVQTSYGPRGWIGGNPQLISAPMPMQNGTGPVHNPAAMYQPGMMTPNANPPMLTPPAPGFAPGFAPQPVSNQPFGYPPPPQEPTTGTDPDIPPPVPSIYPDPAYNNLNNCIYNPKGTTNVYIRGLRPETTDDDLLRMVRQYGDILSTKAIIDTQTKSCKGYVQIYRSGLTSADLGLQSLRRSNKVWLVLLVLVHMVINALLPRYPGNEFISDAGIFQQSS